MNKGVLTRNEKGIWLVKWSDMHSFAHGTHWSFTELLPSSNSIMYVKEDEIRYKPFEEGLEVKFTLDSNWTYAVLIFPEVEVFEREKKIKQYVKNGDELFMITNIDTIRDGGTIAITTSKNKKIYIHKDNWTLHNDYPTTQENIIRDETTQVYILDRIERYIDWCKHRLDLANTIIDKIGKK